MIEDNSKKRALAPLTDAPLADAPLANAPSADAPLANAPPTPPTRIKPAGEGDT
jgi:hypothetical protein